VQIKAFLGIGWVKATTGFLQAFLNVQVLIPFHEFHVVDPTPAMIPVSTDAALLWRDDGRRVARSFLFTRHALSGWWDRAIITLYSVTSADVGRDYCTRCDYGVAVIRVTLDVAGLRYVPNLPSFVYLLLRSCCLASPISPSSSV
jgi:hypothetical protein